VTRRWRTLAVILPLLTLAMGASTAAFAYQAVAMKGGGKVTGFVRLSGPIPARPPYFVNKNKEVCGTEVVDDRLVVGPANGLRYAVVTLADVRKGEAIKLEARSSLDNQKCRFVPHVQAVSVGQFLDLKNTDPIMHNFHAVLNSKRPLFNVGLWPGRELRKPMAYPGLVRINCDVHSWMTAYVIVTDNPYHAVTDLYGQYEIDDIPAGTYTVRVWHELLGTRERKVRVSPGHKTEADFVFAPPPQNK